MTQKAPVTIRPIAEADRPVWQALWHDYLQFYKTTLPQTVYDSTFARLIAGDAGIHGLLAEREGEALGLTHYIFHPTCWKIEPICYLQDLFTTPAARGSGVGRSLIEAVYARADAAGAPGVYWLTAENNYPGRMLYDRVAVKSPFIRYNRPL
jgi:GNAT superfamily N-acetyltransferase